MVIAEQIHNDFKGVMVEYEQYMYAYTNTIEIYIRAYEIHVST